MCQQFIKRIVLIVAFSSAYKSMADKNYSHLSVENIQHRNIKLLKHKLQLGWRQFCAASIDENVMAMFGGSSPCDATIKVLTFNNQSIELPIRAISEIRDFDINPRRKTLLYINAYHIEDTFYSVQEHLKLLQTTRRDYNIIIVDFASDILKLYTSVKHHAAKQGYFVAKIIQVLVSSGVAVRDISIVGHSVGANIAALGANIYAAQAANVNERLLGQLIAIDPAVMCHDADIYVHPNVSERVVIIHGEGDQFSVRAIKGTIDIYPNGIGYFSQRTLQPGCTTNQCSHLYPFMLFMEALIEGVMIPAVKCDSWLHFRQHSCDYNNKVVIGLKYPESAAGVYFCMTQANSPYTYMEHGLKYRNGSAM